MPVTMRWFSGHFSVADDAPPSYSFRLKTAYTPTDSTLCLSPDIPAKMSSGIETAAFTNNSDSPFSDIFADWSIVMLWTPSQNWSVTRRTLRSRAKFA
jgi:hypothetical protein